MVDNALEVNVNIDLKNLNPLALEMTKLYLSTPLAKDETSEEYAAMFIMTYSRFVFEIAKIQANTQLLNNLINKAITFDFSKDNVNNED